MVAFVTTAVVGIVLCVLGCINMTGNISSLHWYHRQRVTEEDRKPFGKLVGLGTLIIGIAIILFGAMFLVFEMTQQEFWVIVGTVFLFVGLGAGLGLSFYAMMKYNKGIF